MERVEEEMTGQLVAASEMMPVDLAFALMLQHKIRHLPVTRDGILIGMISDRDIYKSEQVNLNLKVADIMSKKTYSCEKGARIGDAADVMIEHKIDSLPVTEKDGRLIGIITSYDLLNLLRRKEGVTDHDVETYLGEFPLM